MDVHLTYAAAARWKVDAYVTNLLDNDYITAVNTGTAAGTGSYILGAPRQAGARVTFSF